VELNLRSRFLKAQTDKHAFGTTVAASKCEIANAVDDRNTSVNLE
jgi:hypothetical protein